MNKILHGDSLDLLKDLDDNSVDSIVTDPPYGYSFMGKNWDKAVPSVELWEECLRVLKPGGFAFIMSAPRSDVQSEMIKRLEKAGFRVDFTPVYWTYASGFPKALNIGKKTEEENLDGAYAGYQPKPAVEVVIVVMKPLSEKSYVDQAMKNGKGVTWLDDARIPFSGMDDLETWDYNMRGASERTPDIEVGTTMSEEYGNPEHKWGYKKQKPIPKLKTTNRKPREEGTVFKTSGFKSENNDTAEASPLGRFAANLLVQDDVLGVESKGAQAPVTGNEPTFGKDGHIYGDYTGHGKPMALRNDEGSFSRYYDLDAWWEDRIQELPLDVQTTYPFMIVAKASKSEKNKGLDGLEEKFKAGADFRPNHKEKALEGESGNPYGRWDKVKNFHPTVKPISLMSYLVTLGSREGDLVLDPFVGSGTTCIAAKLLDRKYIGMEMDDGYVVIAQERIKAHEPEVKKHEFF